MKRARGDDNMPSVAALAAGKAAEAATDAALSAAAAAGRALGRTLASSALTMPRRRFFRQRAHINPLGGAQLYE